MSKCNFKILRFLVLRFDIQYVQSKLNYCRYLLCKPATHLFGFRFGWMTGTGWLQHAFRISALFANPVDLCRRFGGKVIGGSFDSRHGLCPNRGLIGNDELHASFL